MSQRRRPPGRATSNARAAQSSRIGRGKLADRPFAGRIHQQIAALLGDQFPRIIEHAGDLLVVVHRVVMKKK